MAHLFPDGDDGRIPTVGVTGTSVSFCTKRSGSGGGGRGLTVNGICALQLFVSSASTSTPPAPSSSAHT